MAAQLAHGARELLDQLFLSLDELRKEIEAAHRERHDPHYVADRLHEMGRLELALRTRIQEDVKPRLRRNEQQPAPLEQRVAALEAKLAEMESGIVRLPKRETG